jgi:flagellar motor switch/type III secretory pathway protein FliN
MPEVSEFKQFLDVPLNVEAVLEGPRMRVGDLLSLKTGSVVVTRFPAGNNVEVVAGESGIGAGELTVSGGRLAVRMVDFRGRD